MAVNETPGRGDDGWVLSNTKQLTSKQGMKFEIVLPSGRKVESEWFAAEHARRALLTWIATIKAENESDQSNTRMQARQNAEKLGLLNRPKPKTDNHDAPLDSAPTAGRVLSIPQKSETAPTITLPVSSTPAVPSLSTPSTGPDAFARDGLAQARADAERWKAEAGNAMERWQAAQRDVEKWERILAAISGGVQINVNKGEATGGLIVTGGSTAPRKRGRPRKQPPAVFADPAPDAGD